jgi:hypothetical protein
MSKNVDFKNIVIRDINGQETKADVTALFGNMLYMQGQNIEECELGVQIYHQGEDALELSDEQVGIVKTYAERLPYVMRTGIKEAVQ